MKRILLTFTVIVAGLSVMAPDINAQSGGYNSPPVTARQKRHDAWQKDMAEFRARSEHDRQLNALADSLASVQAAAAIKNQDFVLEAQNVTFKNGANVFEHELHCSKRQQSSGADLSKQSRFRA